MEGKEAVERSVPEGFFLHVLVVGFHHLKGPIVEYVYPPLSQTTSKTKSLSIDSLIDPNASNKKEEKEVGPEFHSKQEAKGAEEVGCNLPKAWNFLTFSALPDGSHQNDVGESYFTLPPLTKKSQSLFAISKYKQIKTEELKNKTEDMSRSYVQKAIVVIATTPAIGLIVEKLNQVTIAYFDQLDFEDKSIFKDFHISLNSLAKEEISEDLFYTGLPLRQLLLAFKDKTLILIKLLLLQKRIVFFGSTMDKVGLFQFSVLGLLGDTMRHLNYSGTPELNDPYLETRNESFFEDKDMQKIKNNYVPELFGLGAMFQPCLTLQQFDETIDKKDLVTSFLVGTTNPLFEHKDVYDVKVDVDSGELVFKDPVLETKCRLSSADIKFVHQILDAVEQSKDDGAYIGSDFYLRHQFHVYYQSLISSVLYCQSLKLQAKLNVHLKEDLQDRVHELLEEFNLDFINLWAKTDNFQSLVKRATPTPFTDKLEELGHPSHGATIFDSISIKLTNQFKGMTRDKNFTPVVESVSKAFTNMYSETPTEKAKPQPDLKLVEESKPTSSTFGSWFQKAKDSVHAQLEQWDVQIKQSLVETKDKDLKEDSSPAPQSKQAQPEEISDKRVEAKDVVSQPDGKVESSSADLTENSEPLDLDKSESVVSNPTTPHPVHPHPTQPNESERLKTETQLDTPAEPVDNLVEPVIVEEKEAEVQLGFEKEKVSPEPSTKLEPKEETEVDEGGEEDKVGEKETKEEEKEKGKSKGKANKKKNKKVVE